MTLQARLPESQKSATAKQAGAAFALVAATAEAIRDLRTVPSGHLYAQMCGICDLHTYERIIATLVNARLVEKKAHELRWIGPEVSA